MHKENPALGESAGLEVEEVETELPDSNTTVFDSFQFQPITSDYAQAITERERRSLSRPVLNCKATLLLQVQRRQLVRYARMCLADGLALDVDRWLFFVARLIQSLAGPCRVQRRSEAGPSVVIYPPLSRFEIRKWADYGGFYALPEDQLARAEALALRHYALTGRTRCRIDHAMIGRKLALTAAERDRSWFWLSEAIDETPEERKLRKAAEKRERDRVKAAAKREAQGSRPRSAYLAEAESRRRFCEMHRISRQTLTKWLNKGKAWIENGEVLIGSDRFTSASRDKVEKKIPNMSATDLETPCPENREGWPQGRVLEPEPAVPLADLALAWPDGHKEVSDEQRGLWLSREVLDRMRQAVR